MSSDDTDGHKRMPEARHERAARAAAALRDNLRKRKAQQRGRAQAASTTEADATTGNAGPDATPESDPQA
jgi:hypothetical protein